MIKKLILATAILATTSTISLAASPYIGGSLGLINNAAKGGYGPTYRGIDGNISLGYGGVVTSNLYLGGEVLAVPGSITVSDSNRLKTSWGVGASIIPGVMLNQTTLGYARLGVIDSRFSSLNKTVVGGQTGLGMQTNVCQNFDVRGEYVYTKYRSVSHVSAPNSDAFNVGLIYKFE